MTTNKNPIDYLLSPLASLTRVGGIFEKMLIGLVRKNCLLNLIFHKPVRLENIAFCPNIFEVQNDQMVVLKLKIESHVKPQKSRQPYKILGSTEGGYVALVFFKIYPSQIEKLAIGHEVAVLGRLQKSLSENQINHPQEILPANRINELPKIDVIYPLTQTITQKFLRAKIFEALKNLEDINVRNPCEKWIDDKLLKSKNWPKFVDALKKIHTPEDNNDIDSLQNKARQRLAYNELLAFQLAMLVSRKAEEALKTRPELHHNFHEESLQNLPFPLTNAQKKVIVEIEDNILSPKKMLRLLQGDVGSGKTIVAIYACLLAAACGKQCCVIVPIAILAEQHFNYFQNLLKKFDIKIEILTGKTTKKQREKILANLKNAETDILISTHAALQDDVLFKNLGLAVIVEQHRFGVMRRLKLVEKGKDVDVLLMSATPIPRSLMMALYGDMEISILNEKPANRKNINTIIRSQNNAVEIYEGFKRAMARHEKIYWICPAIAENEESDLASAEEKHKELQNIFGESTVALLHGKMKESEKDKIMHEFKNGNSINILVATTVIEVGVDVKDATIIVIDNAENFGLSQLHQLRGRVGRSDLQSYCILLYGKKYGAIAKQRLAILRESNDGFYIAEEDLKLRGSGEMLGTKQSGLLEFEIADLTFDTELLKIANKNAQIILEKEKNFLSQKYRDLLRLYDYDQCLRIITSG